LNGLIWSFNLQDWEGGGVQVLALEAAVVDLKKTKAEGGRLRPDHLRLTKSFDHSKLVEQYAPYIKGALLPLGFQDYAAFLPPLLQSVPLLPFSSSKKPVECL
jgi:hypothetical protein